MLTALSVKQISYRIRNNVPLHWSGNWKHSPSLRVGISKCRWRHRDVFGSLQKDARWGLTNNFSIIKSVFPKDTPIWADYRSCLLITYQIVDIHEQIFASFNHTTDYKNWELRKISTYSFDLLTRAFLARCSIQCNIQKG